MEGTTTPMPLDVLEGIKSHLDNEEVTKALLGDRLVKLEKAFQNLSTGQNLLNRRMDDQDVLLANQAAAAKASAEVGAANNVLLQQLTDLFAAGRVGTNLVAWLGKTWPGLVVIGLGVRELWRTHYGH